MFAPQPHLCGLTHEAFASWARARGASAGSARALAKALVARAALRAGPRGSPPARGLLDEAERHFEDRLPQAPALPDPDGSVRFTVHLGDGEVVETVAIFQPAGAAETGGRRAARWTICVSSQVGCGRGCVFCETGRLGLVRNLSVAEIVQQVAIATRYLRERNEAAPRNVVFMGMGEPLDNLDAVVGAIDVLREHAGFAVPERRITVSTVGIVPRLDELFARTRVNVALSLHALEPSARRALLPVARRWDLATLRAAISRAPRPVLLQWTLIEGVNDREDDADALARFCEGLSARVNLIPLNPGPAREHRAPPLERCRQFQRRLADQGVRALLRLPHGQSVGGACGQLAGPLRAAR